MKRTIFVALVCLTSGCGLLPQPIKVPQVITVPENPVPGTVHDAWEAPIYDQIEIPAQLDPNGITYRPKHTSIVEIPLGRVQEVQYPDDRPQSSSDIGAQQ